MALEMSIPPRKRNSTKRISIELFLGRTTIAFPVTHDRGAEIFTEPHVAPRQVMRS
jgi:hypothetical protein